MHQALFRLLLILLCCLSTSALAATDYSMRTEWSEYVAPSELTLIGCNLHQGDVIVCQHHGASATSLDCLMSLFSDITNLTLTADFNNDTQLICSALFAFKKLLPTIPSVSTTSTIDAELASYTSPRGYTTTGYNLYTEGLHICRTQIPSVTPIDLTASPFADAPRFSLKSAFSNGTKSPHSPPFTFTKPIATLPQATITANVTVGTVPFEVYFSDINFAQSDRLPTTPITTSASDSANASYTSTSKNPYTTAPVVTDYQGVNNATCSPIIVQDEPFTAEIEPVEVTVTAVTGSVRVLITNTYQNPIVVADPSNIKDSVLCGVRSRNITPTGIETKMAEWNYLKGVHKKIARYLVMEKGCTTLPGKLLLKPVALSAHQASKQISLLNLSPMQLLLRLQVKRGMNLMASATTLRISA